MAALSSRRREAFTLVEMLVVIVIISILAGLLIPVINIALRRAKIAACSHNLGQLFKTAQLYGTRHKGAWPSGQGEEFWLSLQKTQPPLIKEGLSAVFACPLKERFGGPGTCDFRGPANPVSRLDADDPVGADKSGNHGEEYAGNVLRLAGDVQEAELGDKLWELCSTKLAP